MISQIFNRTVRSWLLLTYSAKLSSVNLGVLLSSITFLLEKLALSEVNVTAIIN